MLPNHSGPLRSPKVVFDNPDAHVEFLLTSRAEDFEGQEFDRKQVGSGDGGEPGKKHLAALRDKVVETVCAFTNGSPRGGLLVLGVSDDGRPLGVESLDEDAANRLTDFGPRLRNHCAQARLINLKVGAGVERAIILVYAAYHPSLICETNESNPRFWVRSGRQNLNGDDSLKEALKREKRIVNFEATSCCPFDSKQLDPELLSEFRKQALPALNTNRDIDELLTSLGAVDGHSGARYFTNVGYLFFAASPERVLGARYIRLLRFEVPIAEREARGAPNFDRTFTGPVAQQIRRIRVFFRESGFFKVYQVRRPEGGFREEHEYPPIAIDEAIVNAVAHRDYGVGEPITCEVYRDAFVVRNPGRLRQRNQLVPSEFRLSDIRLETVRNNPILTEWLSRMRDSEGTAYVQLVNEGTTTMREVTAEAGLPAPLYVVSESETRVTLFNDIERREAQFRHAATAVDASPDEFTNLFPLTVATEEGAPLDPQMLLDQRAEVMTLLASVLKAQNWHVDHFRRGTVEAHRRGSDLEAPREARALVRFYPGYAFRLRGYGGKAFLCIDYELQVKNVASVAVLRTIVDPELLLQRLCTFQWEGWQEGRITRMDEEQVVVSMAELGVERTIPAKEVIPFLPVRVIAKIVNERCPRFEFHRVQKTHSLASIPAASRVRAEKSLSTAVSLAELVFPLKLGTSVVQLGRTPTPLLRKSDGKTALSVIGLQEPKVVFYERQQTADIRDGITRFGSYAHDSRQIELIPVCLDSSRARMEALIERLKGGKFKYKGAERTFGVRFTYPSVVTVPDSARLKLECARLLDEHREWSGEESLGRCFFIETPEAPFALDDEASPYYSVKRLLLEKGVPCQMVDTPTLENPDWKDLNLALNLAAKCGVRPWVLPNALPDADFFVGLSYTQSERGPNERLMGYANVFNSFGHWEFYSANTHAFTFENRHEHLRELVRRALDRLTLPESPHIHFHYSKRFSREDRAVLLNAARSVRPNGIYSFVWVNIGHGLRLYDRRPETDGSLARGNYVIAGPNQIYVSTTGWNPYRKGMGTPVVLEVNVRTERPDGRPQPPDLRTFAIHILSLTKLNWASTDSLCAEPITTKYAGDIAYLTAAFLRQGGPFQLHQVLERTPWFI
jgi:predicted HTH transcriptional regulator